MDHYLPIPQPDEISSKERDDAMGSYLMMFAAWAAGLPLPMLNILASVIYYFVNRKNGNFVRFHALQSMWSQILLGLINAFGTAWLIKMLFDGEFSGEYFYPYLITAIIINIFYIIFSIIAAVYAKKGRFFYFIFFGKIAFHRAYSANNSYNNQKDYTNRPPM